MSKIAITKTKAIYTDKYQLKGGNYPQNVNFIDSFYKNIDTGYRYVAENMYDELFSGEDKDFYKNLLQKMEKMV